MTGMQLVLMRSRRNVPFAKCCMPLPPACPAPSSCMHATGACASSSWHADAGHTIDGLLVLPTVRVSDTHDHDEEGENVEDEVKEAGKQLHGDPAVRAVVHSCVIVPM